jgi:hypothetical protein
LCSKIFTTRSALLKHGRDIHYVEFDGHRPVPVVKDVTLSEDERRRNADQKRGLYYKIDKQEINE